MVSFDVLSENLIVSLNDQEVDWVSVSGSLALAVKMITGDALKNK
jgi:hypothetical protein